MTLCIRKGLVPRSRAIAGSAVFKIVLSSICMKKAIATTHGSIFAVFGSRTGLSGICLLVSEFGFDFILQNKNSA